MRRCSRSSAACDVLTYTAAEITAYLADRNRVMGHTTPFSIAADELTESTMRCSGRADEFVRIGGIVPGPVLMAIVDCVGWMTTMTHVPTGGDALTTDLSMQFLRGLPAGPFVVDAELLGFSKRSAIVAMRIGGAVGDDPAAAATITFAPRFPR